MAEGPLLAAVDTPESVPGEWGLRLIRGEIIYGIMSLRLCGNRSAEFPVQCVCAPVGVGGIQKNFEDMTAPTLLLECCQQPCADALALKGGDNGKLVDIYHRRTGNESPC